MVDELERQAAPACQFQAEIPEIGNILSFFGVSYVFSIRVKALRKMVFISSKKNPTAICLEWPLVSIPRDTVHSS
jgi:hypothetical protein